MQLPAKKTNRWRQVRIIYTADDGTNRLMAFHHYKDTNGDDFLPLPPSLLTRVIVNNKDKLWEGKNDTLRQLPYLYEEPGNSTLSAQGRVYNPFPPLTKENVTCYDEVRQLLADKFTPYRLWWCLDYKGEDRATVAKPRRPDLIEQ